ncbi:MAG: nitroreductase [Candidatus Poseidoniaceae archaeon]|jgi:nitroreductase|nr:nitroreductase [Candidatus Poseidoniaceae archaeon]
MTKDFDSNDFSSFVSSRRSTRDFQSTPIPDKLIEEIIADGLTSPSWSNTRPFVVAVAKDDVRDRISKEFLSRFEAIKSARGEGFFAKIKAILRRKGLPTSNWLIIRPYHKDLVPRSKRVGKEMLAHIGIERGDKEGRDAFWARNYEFFGAPVEMFVFTHKSLGKFATSDAGLFMQNLMLSAHSKGLGTCAQGSVAVWEDVVRKEFSISKKYSLLCGICLGYPSEGKINSFNAHRIAPSEIIAPVKK